MCNSLFLSWSTSFFRVPDPRCSVYRIGFVF